MNYNNLICNGIDVSRYQGDINWVKVKQSQQFAFIRIGWAGYDGSITIDEKFYQNIVAANKIGLDVGVYVYSYCQTSSAAVRAARQAIELVKPYTLTYPIAFDLEDNMYTKHAKIENTVIATAFLGEIEKNKYYAMLYTYTYFANTYIDMLALSRFDLWIADYRENLGYNGSYGIWQYTSTGKVDGISTDVDKNYSYKNYPEIIRLAGLNQAIPTPPSKIYYGVNVFYYDTRESAEDAGRAFKLLDLYNEIKYRDLKYIIEVFSFAEHQRAEDIAKAIKTITGKNTQIVQR